MHHCHVALSVVINFSHFRLLIWSGIQRILTGSKISTSSTKFVLIGPIEKKKQDGRPGILLTATFSTSPLKPLNGIQRNLKGSKISTSSTKFVVFGPIGKTRWPPQSLIDWDILNFSSVTAIWNSTKLGRKQDLNVLYQGCVFPADWKNKMATRLLIGWDILGFSSETDEWNSTKFTGSKISTSSITFVFSGLSEEQIIRPACDWLRHYRFLLWNHWMEFNKIWQDARSQRPLISLCFSGRSEEKDGRPVSDLPRHFDFSSRFNETWQEARSQRPLPICVIRADKKGRPGLWLAETFSTSPLWPLNRIQRNLTGSKISTSSIPSSCYLIDETWQEARYQCPIQSLGYFGADEKNKMAAPASDWLRHFRLLLWTEFNKTWQEIRYVNAIFQVCIFRADRKNILLMFTIWVRPFGPLVFCIK